MEDILKKAQQEANRGDLGIFFRLASGEQATGRLLIDGDDALVSNMHKKWDDSKRGWEYIHFCAKHLGLSCIWCEQESDNGDDFRQEHYTWLIWNQTEKKLQILHFPRSQTSPVDELASQYAVLGTLTKCDFVFRVSGPAKEKNNWRYHIVNLPESSFSLSENGIKLRLTDTGDVDVPAAKKMMIRMIAQGQDPQYLEQLKANAKPAKEPPAKSKPKPEPVTVPAETESYEDDLDSMLGD